MTVRPSASLNKPSNGSAPDFKAIAMLIVSASQVDDAVLPWRFKRQAIGQQRLPSADWISIQKPNVDFVFFEIPCKIRVGRHN